MNDFTPPALIQKPHIQSLLSSMKLLRPFVFHRVRHMLRNSQSHVLDCGDGIRLHGYYSDTGNEDIQP